LISRSKTRYRKAKIALALLAALGVGFALGVVFTRCSIPPITKQVSVTTEKPALLPGNAQEDVAVKNESSKEGYWCKVFKPDVLPVWLGSLFSLGVGIIALTTLGDIKKQTGIGLEAANAAKLSADTAFTVQLPTLFLSRCDVQQIAFKDEIEWLLNPIVTTALHNYGQTPAFIVSWSIGIAYKNVPVGLAAETPLNKVIKPDTDGWLPTVTPENFVITSEVTEEIATGKGWYTVNGIVIYDDLFGNRKTFEFCRGLVFRNGKIVLDEC
jgi:hypothetical protein